MRKFLVIMVSVCIGFSGFAQAEELLNLWPNQRSKHQDVMEEQLLKYQARNQDYIDHMYTTQGEEPMPDPEGFMELSDPVLDPTDINVDEVSNIVGQSAEPVTP